MWETRLYRFFSLTILNGIHTVVLISDVRILKMLAIL